MPPADWKLSLEQFFHHRALLFENAPTLHDHCIVSAKDPRIWARPELHRAMVESITSALHANGQSRVLEVGCASGYVACGLAPEVGHYTGVDLASQALAVARSMGLPRADFQISDGAALAFEDDLFDAAFAYDVFTNFPSFADGVRLITEMLRVVRPGGRVLIGSLTKAATAAQFQAHATEVVRELDRVWGPLPAVPLPVSNDHSQDRVGGAAASKVVPAIAGYYFEPADFVALARQHEVEVEIADVHEGNPYRGFRFNVIYTKTPT
jgi:SAM-dependent methyltransferase